MAADLGPLSLTQLQQLAQQNTSCGSWMWNSRRPAEEDDSWEVRAFAEDTNNVMGSTWPPRSYTCTFCHREFRSAQALGGHMNVHRRDRARLHQLSPGNDLSPSSTTPSSLMYPTQEFVAGGALCLLYQLPTPNPIVSPTTMTSSGLDSPSTLLSISSYPANSSNVSSSSPLSNFQLAKGPHHAANSASMIVESNRPNHKNNKKDDENCCSNWNNDLGFEDLDLELRLGQRPSTHQN